MAEVTPGLRLFRSNRVEALTRGLARVVDKPLDDPLATEVVAVPNPGLGRWLTLQLADQCGLSMNLRFPFVQEIAGEVLENPTGLKPGELQEAMAWLLLELLHDLGQSDIFEIPRHYLASGDPLRRWQLAKRLAGGFSSYLTFRPGMLAAWQAGEEPHDWQASLWRRLLDVFPDDRLRFLTKNIPSVSLDLKTVRNLPERINCFGVSVLAPLHLAVLQRLAEHKQVNLFTTAPTAEYWEAAAPSTRAVPATGAASRGGASQSFSSPPEDNWSDDVNPLLASWGRGGLELFRQFLDVGIEAEAEEYFEPGEDRLLHLLQGDILNMRDARTDPRPAPGCDSIRWVSCHSRIRELEALRDFLLEAFSEDSSLRPRDVLVLCPRINDFSAGIEAVFGQSEEGASLIPFTIADRPPRSEQPLVDIFFTLLELIDERLTSRNLFEVFSHDFMRHRFRWGERELECIRSWVSAAGIRWGLDRQAKQRAGGLPVQTSWQDGLERLMLGLVAGPEAGVTWQGYAAAPGIRSEDAELLSSLVEAVGMVQQLAAEAEGQAPFSAWSARFSRMLASLFQEGSIPSESAEEVAGIRSAVNRFQELSEGLNSVMDARTAVAALESLLPPPSTGGGFLRGSLTFCELQPLRNVPARIVCILGLDDGAFPRRDPRPSFHRIERRNRLPGDVFPDELDRLLFLETILSARDRLYLSYCGQNQQDDATRPPAVILGELTDYLQAAYPGAFGSADEAVPLQRAMHPFGRADFSGKRGGGTSAAFEKIARRLADPLKTSRSLLDERAPPLEPPATINLDQIAAAFEHPAAAYLEERLGLTPEEHFSLLEETDALEMDGLDRFRLRRDILDCLVAGEGTEQVVQAFAGTGRLPPGEVGELAVLEATREAEPLAATARRLRSNETRRNASIHLNLAEPTITMEARVGPLFGNALVLAEPARMKHKRRLRAWLSHLFICAAGEIPATTHLLCLDEHVALAPLEAGAAMAHLVEISSQVLVSWETPWAFTGVAVWDYASRAFAPSGGRKKPETSAQDLFEEEIAEDRPFDLCFGGAPELDLAACRRVAEVLWKPYFAALLASPLPASDV